jgi:NAD(P)H-dependent flavin oxidoreductase YrpB (nitropropane dioxygenase family)
MARFTAPIPSWGGDFRPPALDRRLSLRTTDKTIIIRVPTTCRRDDRLVARSGKREEARRDRDRLRGEILATHQAGRPHETLLTAGQTAGGIKEILPVAENMHRLVAESEAALSRAEDFR